MKCYSSAWLRIPSSTSSSSSASSLLLLSSEKGAAADGAAQFQVAFDDDGDDKRRRSPRGGAVGLGFLGLKRIFTQVIFAAMGCFFGCFGVKDSTPTTTPISDSSSSTPAVKVGSVIRKRSSLSSLLLSEENNATPIEGRDDQDLGTPKPELGFDFKELKNEAKFLKACGTLPETPEEIRKVSEKLQDLSVQKGEQEGLKFRSWLTTDTSIEKLNLETESNQRLTPIKDCEQWVKVSGSVEHTPSSCMTDGQNAGRVSTSSIEGNETKNARSNELIDSPSNSLTGSSVTPGDIAPILPCKNKSVRFDFNSDMSSVSSKSYTSETSCQSLKQSGSASNSSIAKSSPYPTPLKLSDEMQTPGTVFPAYLDAMGLGKTTRIRSQYAYSVLNPVENLSQWKELKNEGLNSDDQNNHSGESLGQNDEETPISEAAIGKTSVEKELKVESSLSSWLRAPLRNSNGNVGYNGSLNSRCARTPGDRPILGMVAAHWNDDEPSEVSPKTWDGNGIPNSTNKYKEDQKVSWHATPFEERLEKALSEETFISQRKQTSGTSPPDSTEESDTALSQLQTSNHFKPVVSF